MAVGEKISSVKWLDLKKGRIIDNSHEYHPCLNDLVPYLFTHFVWCHGPLLGDYFDWRQLQFGRESGYMASHLLSYNQLTTILKYSIALLLRYSWFWELVISIGK